MTNYLKASLAAGTGTEDLMRRITSSPFYGQFTSNFLCIFNTSVSFGEILEGYGPIGNFKLMLVIDYEAKQFYYLVGLNEAYSFKYVERLNDMNTSPATWLESIRNNQANKSIQIDYADPNRYIQTFYRDVQENTEAFNELIAKASELEELLCFTDEQIAKREEEDCPF